MGVHNMGILEKIQKFVEYNYYRRKDIIAIIFYGSSKYETNTKDSDIDLLILTAKSKCFKGVTYIDNTRIEFFEKNFETILEEIENIDASQDNSLLSIFKNGQLISGDEITFNYLKEQIDFERKIPKYQNSSQISQYLTKIEETNNYFYKNYFYYNLLDKIRKKYHEERGYASISGQKAPELYQKRDYAEKYYCLRLPDQEFINQFQKALENGYDANLLTILLTKVDYTKEQSTNYQNVNELMVKCYSTIVESSINRSIRYLSQNNKNSLNSYYLAVEKIIILYCMINQLNYSIDYFKEEYDIEFLTLLDKTITHVSIENITNLFDFTTKNLDINYKSYKILDLK